MAFEIGFARHVFPTKPRFDPCSPGSGNNASWVSFASVANPFVKCYPGIMKPQRPSLHWPTVKPTTRATLGADPPVSPDFRVLAGNSLAEPGRNPRPEGSSEGASYLTLGSGSPPPAHLEPTSSRASSTSILELAQTGRRPSGSCNPSLAPLTHDQNVVSPRLSRQDAEAPLTSCQAELER